MLATARAVRAFGARAERIGAGWWRLRGSAWRSPAGAIDCGNSATAARLLMGAAAGFPLEAIFTGDDSLRTRPMDGVIEPLVRMGARFEGSHRLPARLSGGRLRGRCHVSATASAQVKSAVLLAGLQADGPVELVEPAPTRDHTETLLRAFGCDVETSADGNGRRIRLGERRMLAGTSLQVAGDSSSAAFPLVAALVTPGSEVTVEGVGVNPLRFGLFETLIEMGADLAFANRRTIGGEAVADVTARSSRLCAVTVPAARAPSMIDEYPILGIAAAFAAGTTEMRGVGELRVKETDRLQAMAEGLRACGIAASAAGENLRIAGGNGSVSGGAQVRSHGDHRIAMSFLALGLAAREPVSVDRTETIATSFPAFVTLMHALGAAIE